MSINFEVKTTPPIDVTGTVAKAPPEATGSVASAPLFPCGGDTGCSSSSSGSGSTGGSLNILS